jgi:hypothetical protein
MEQGVKTARIDIACGLDFGLTREGNTERLMTLSQFVAVDGSEFVLHLDGGREAVGDRIDVGKCVNCNRLDQRNADVPDARDVAPLARPHVAEFPQANRLRFFAGADRGEKLFLEEEHGVGPTGR